MVEILAIRGKGIYVKRKGRFIRADKPRRQASMPVRVRGYTKRIPVRKGDTVVVSMGLPGKYRFIKVTQTWAKDPEKEGEPTLSGKVVAKTDPSDPGTDVWAYQEAVVAKLPKRMRW